MKKKSNFFTHSLYDKRGGDEGDRDYDADECGYTEGIGGEVSDPSVLANKVVANLKLKTN